MSVKDRFQNKTFYENKTRFLNAVSGNKIMEEQSAINSDSEMVVVATQMEKRDGIKITNKQDENKPFAAYDCWIYYVVRKKQDAQQPQQQNVQSTPQQPVQPQPQPAEQPIQV